MWVAVDKNNFITIASWGGILEDGFEVKDFDFDYDIQAYKYVDGVISLDVERLQQLQEEQLALKEIQELQAHLANTASIVLQRFEENELGLEHQNSDEEFGEILRERQEARVEIRRRINLYPSWMPEVDYKLGDVIPYSNELYQVLQNHTSADHWRPPQAYSLYRRIT